MMINMFAKFLRKFIQKEVDKILEERQVQAQRIELYMDKEPLDEFKMFRDLEVTTEFEKFLKNAMVWRLEAKDYPWFEAIKRILHEWYRMEEKVKTIIAGNPNGQE